jgi:mannose-1-phosphate guanylyltransferase
MNDSQHERPDNWAVILAGGDGVRLRDLSYSVSGDGRPKQFCPFFGGKSLLAHTRERILPLFREENTLFVLNRAHEVHYRSQLADVPSSRRLVQPSNRGTAAAIALSVLAVLQRDTHATLAFFPSDHHYLEPSVFRATLSCGLRLAKDYPDRILIVGAHAHYLETEYGWIEPGPASLESARVPLHFVSAFWESQALRRHARCKRAAVYGIHL